MLQVWPDHLGGARPSGRGELCCELEARQLGLVNSLEFVQFCFLRFYLI